MSYLFYCSRRDFNAPFGGSSGGGGRGRQTYGERRGQGDRRQGLF
jgi:hypothetical protein